VRPARQAVRRATALAALAAALLPVAASAQAGRVAVRQEPAGLLVGQACLDLDGDGRCGPGEPGLAGARLVLSDGRRVTADEAGRFHLSRLSGRALDRRGSAYGAVAVKLEGLGEARVVELGPGGAAGLDVALPPPSGPAPALAVDRAPQAAPVRRDGELLWPVEGQVTPGSRVRVDGREAAVAADGRFTGEARLSTGRNAVVVSALAPGGAAAVEALEWLVVRLDGGGVRLYPGGARRLADLHLRPTAAGLLVTGRAAPGVVLRIGGVAPRQADGGAFAVHLAGEAEPVALELTQGALALREALPAAPPAGRIDGVAHGDLELSFGSGGTRLAGRGAGRVDGRLAGLRLSAGVDLDDRDRTLTALARPRDEAEAGFTPERPRDLAASGDGSAAGDDDPGRGRLWARADADGASLRLGWTRSGLGGDGLGRFDRALFGGRVAGEAAAGPVRLEAAAFGAASGHEVGGQGPARAVHEELTGTGGSLYYLAGGALVAGSVQVRLAWRDPVTGLTTPARTLVRGVDYALDEATGRLWLARPLSASGAPRLLATGDPLAGPEALLLVDALDAAGTGAARLAGGLAGAALGPLRLEARAAEASAAGPDWRLLMAGATLDLGEAAVLRLEVARTEGRLDGGAGAFLRSLDGGFSAAAAPVPPPAAPGGARALHASGHGEAAGVGWSAWWRERGAGYSDGTWLEARAARERGAEVGGAAGPLRLRLGWAERTGSDERDPSGATPLDRRRGAVRASGEVGPVTLTGELLHDRDEGLAPAHQTAAGLSAAWRAAPALGLELSHLQALATSGPATALTFTGAGATLRWGDGSLALRGGWGPDLGPRLLLAGERRDPGGAVYGTLGADPIAPSRGGATGSVVGARSEAGPVTLFTEEQVAEDRQGLRAGRMVGAAVRPAAGLRLSVQAERGERLVPGGPARLRSGAGASAALERGPFAFAARGEVLEDGSADRFAASGSASWAATPRLSLALHGLVARGRVEGRRADDLDASLGLAWRGDGRAALLTIGRLETERPEVARREAWLVSGAATAAAGERLRLGLGARLAVQRLGGVRDDRLAGSARLEVRVAGPVDAGVEYARRAALGVRVPGDLDALRLEAGVTVGPSRLALGWTLVGFAGDGVDPAGDANRFFLRATLGL